MRKKKLKNSPSNENWINKILPTFLLCIFVAGIVIAVGNGYINFITQKIYSDSTNQLKEIYSQVNRSFQNLMDQNWNILDSYQEYFDTHGQSNESTLNSYIQREKENWGYTDFYFLSENHEYFTIEEQTGTFVLEDNWNKLLQDKEKILVSETFNDSKEKTIFAIPTKHSSYKEFEYDAIAISYNNEDIVKKLNVDILPKDSRCIIGHSNGKILVSTFDVKKYDNNYFQYLKNNSNLSDKDLTDIQNDLKTANFGLKEFDIEEVNRYLVYGSIGQQDYFLISSIPQESVSAEFLSIQNATTRFMIIISVLIGVTIIVIMAIHAYKSLRKNRMEFRFREKLFDVLSNSVDDIFILLNYQNRSVDYISPNIERLLGLTEKEATENLRILEQIAINKKVVISKEELEAIPFNSNRYWECDYRHQKTGERRNYRLTVYPVLLENVKKYLFVLSDRTLERQMNQQMEAVLAAATSANEAKSNFLSNMSHDIRTPMNAIVGFSVLLEKDASNEEKVREYTHKIMASSNHLLSLINDVLDMSKIESGKTSLNIHRFSLPSLLEELNIIIMPQAKAKKQNFVTRVQGTPPEQIMGDKLRINQILINLLSNAVKYTKDEGKIEFIITQLPSQNPQYVKLRFIVKDNGIGMSKEFQEHVFDPFAREINSVTNSVQGSGLGMAITKNLVDLMGGIITLDSEIGVGSTFTVEMSFGLPEQEEKEEEWYRQKINRMLVTDDEEDICLNIKEMMRDTGVEVSIALEGSEAVAKAEKAHQEKEDFDVILLDWKMPNMDGVETARQIRKKVGDHIPILVLTSYDWDEIEAEAKAAGINAFMPKPFFTSVFWDTIKPLVLKEESKDSVKKKIEKDTQQEIIKDKLFLVAEDNELNAEILSEMLAMEGAKCELATNGLEAVEMFQSKDPDYYDMILMDVQMPKMNGYDATREIRSLNHPRAKTIPIIAMTANTFAEDVRNALDAGMNGHLAKPIEMETFRTLVARLLKEDSEKRKETK